MMPRKILTRTGGSVLVAAAATLTAACATAPAVVVPPGSPVAGNSFVVRDVRVFDGEGTVERTNVIVRDGRIASVGRAAPPRELPVVNGAGHTLLPGFIDAHGHVPSESSLRDALRFGVTTVLDMMTRVEVTRTQKPQRETLARTDRADLWSAGSPITSPGGLGTQFGIPVGTISSPDEAPAFVRARLAEGSDYIKILYEPGAPVFTSISRETLEALIAAARAQGVLAVVHVSSVQGARDATRAGADGLAHSFSDSLIDAELSREIAARGTFVTTTLSIVGALRNRGIGSALAADRRVSPYLSAGQRRNLTAPGPGPDYPLAPYLVRFDIDRAQENIRRLHAAGVRILAGTDAPNLTSHGVSLHGELQLLTEAGLTPAEALQAATRGPADEFRLSDRGRITPGARADLVLVEGNPLADITATRAIARVFKNGFETSRTPPPSPAQTAPAPAGR